MAKAKKSKLTIEDALVPVEEQPYEIPQNWCWVKINSVANVYTGNSINERVKADKYEGQLKGILFIATKDVDFDNSINYETNVRITDPDNYKKAPANTALLCIEGGSAGKKIGFTNQEVCFGNKLCAFASDKIEPKYIYYFLQSNAFIYQFNDKKHGLIGGVSVKDLCDIGITLPPLAEQKRIVEQIESLFAKLDEAKELVSDSIQKSSLRLKSLINSVFTGELLNIRDVHTVPLVDLVNEIKIGPFGSSLHKEDYIENGIPVINPKHINKQTIVPATNVTIPKKKAEELSAYVLKSNDIIMGRRGEMGRTAPVSIKEEGYICGTGSLIIRLKDSYRADFYSQILASQEIVSYLDENCVGSTMSNLNEKIVKKIPVPYFTPQQQEELMLRLNMLLSEENQIMEKLDGIVDAISMMKKSILAKAFRGELGTNNPDEESAVELLRSILEQEE